MKHYWINIDSCTDRKDFIENQFKDMNIDHFRISAETPETISKYYIIRNDKSENTQAEIACILSHLKAIKKGYEDGEEYFCILEDDMIIPKLNFTKIFKYMKDVESKDGIKIDLLQLFTNSHPFIIEMYNKHIKKYDKEFIINRKEDCPSTGYYLISREGAKKLMNQFILSETYYDLSYSFWTAADNVLYRPINTYILTYPITVSNCDYGSTIHPLHVINHENANIVIKKIWTADNQLDKFI